MPWIGGTILQDVVYNERRELLLTLKSSDAVGQGDNQPDKEKVKEVN